MTTAGSGNQLTKDGTQGTLPWVAVRIFKSIYRLDFPLCFALMDSLGKHAESMHDAAGGQPFQQDKTKLFVDFVNHVVMGRLTVREDQAQFNLSVKQFDITVEYGAGQELGEAHRHPTVDLATRFFKSVQAAPIRGIERVGIRHWILVEHEKFRFAELRECIANRLRSVRTAVATSFPTLEDVGTVFEACSDDGTHVRVVLGPYREAERERYFTFQAVGIKEALIVDVDMWQTKIEMPAFSLVASAKAYERMARSVIEKLVEKLLEDLK